MKHAKLRIRVPALSDEEPAKNLQRRFLPTDPLQIVFDYLLSEGYPVEKFKVLSSWPRRDVSWKEKNLFRYDILKLLSSIGYYAGQE